MKANGFHHVFWKKPGLLAILHVYKKNLLGFLSGHQKQSKGPDFSID